MFHQVGPKAEPVSSQPPHWMLPNCLFTPTPGDPMPLVSTGTCTWPYTNLLGHSIDPGRLKIRGLPASTSGVLGLKSYTTTSGFIFFILIV